jgi:UDP-GlcNAc:undecaprenyl-phosphate GlcNAc-1-phosphate transferase
MSKQLFAVPGLAMLASFALALIVCLYAQPIGRALKVMDAPDEHRKHHRRPTPLVGGIAIMLPLAVWCCASFLFFPSAARGFEEALLLCGLGVAVVGFADDQSGTLPLGRTLSVFVFLMIAFVMEPGLISPALDWGSFQPTDVSPWIYCTLMAVSVIGLVNAINMADGQNGVVASMFVIWSLCLTLVTKGTLDAAVILLGLSFIALLFNLRGKLFLGDCGSYGVTFVLSLLSMWVYAKGFVTVQTLIVWFFIPVADCLRLIISRPLRGRSPFAGDRDHFHHRILAKLGERFSLITYIGMVALTSLVSTLMPHLSLVCLVVLTAFYFSYAWLTDPPELQASEENEHAGRRIEGSSGVVPLRRNGPSAKSRPHDL